MHLIQKGKMYLSEKNPAQVVDQNRRVIAYECICTIIDTTEINAKKSIEIMYEQWRVLTSVLNTSLLSACNQSNYVKQTFQNEYPKLLKLQNDFWVRLLQLNPLVDRYQYLDITDKNKLKSNSQIEKPNYLSSYELLRKCFYDLENSYLNRSLSHLFDPINLIFSQNFEKQINRSDIETYIKGILTNFLLI